MGGDTATKRWDIEGRVWDMGVERGGVGTATNRLLKHLIQLISPNSI